MQSFTTTSSTMRMPTVGVSTCSHHMLGRLSRTTNKNGRTLLVSRAEPEQSTENTNTTSTVFYAGRSYNENEWAEAVASGVVSPAPAEPQEAVVGDVSIADVMAFSGPGPEIINGRLAMLAFVSAFFAELASGESALSQWSDEPTGVALTFILFSVASLIPMLNNSTKREAFGPFTPEAETLNGRLAMMGFFSLLVIEGVRGSALF
jgi:hypothetical protein